jgi:hypothetical protein
MTKPEIPVGELRLRFAALGQLRELPGERTFLGRCHDFDAFLVYGPSLVTFANKGAVTLSMHDRAGEPYRTQWRGLFALCMAAWPQGDDMD